MQEASPGSAAPHGHLWAPWVTPRVPITHYMPTQGPLGPLGSLGTRLGPAEEQGQLPAPRPCPWCPGSVGPLQPVMWGWEAREVHEIRLVAGTSSAVWRRGD